MSGIRLDAKDLERITADPDGPQLMGDYHSGPDAGKPATKAKTDAQRDLEKQKRRALENSFESRWRSLDGPDVLEREKTFHPQRGWKWDFSIPSIKLAIEIDGGQWSEKGHGWGNKMENDYLKQNAAEVLGWRVFRFCTTMIDGPNWTVATQLVIDCANELLEEAERES